jgi:V/A-type H+-transporting ATPase subunit I
MAVVPMRKVFLVAHRSLKESLLTTLQEHGLLQISNLQERLVESELSPLIEKFEPQIAHLELHLSETQFVLDLIEDFSKKKKGIVAGLLKERVSVSRLKFDTIENRIDFHDVYKRCEELDVRYTQLNHRLSSLATLKSSFVPWESLKIPLSRIAGTDYTVLQLGKIPYKNVSLLLQEVEENYPAAEIDTVGKDAQSANLLLIFLKEQENEVSSLLQRHGLNPTSFAGPTETPLEEIRKIEEEVERIGKEKEDIAGKIREIEKLKPELLTLHDFIDNRLKRAQVEGSFAHTEQAFMAEGWIESPRENELEREVAAISPEVELTVLEPAPEENPPVVLKNGKLVQPFEVLVGLYGLPDYRELDPTPFIAPFFALFFGITIGDFGYGLILAVASVLAIRKLDVGEGGRRFFQVLGYGGLSSMLVGILTGGYFGIPIESLPSFLRALVVLDPLKNAFIFLIAVVILGFVHVCLGVLLKMVNNIRNGMLLDGLYDQGSTLALIVTLTAYGVTRNSVLGWLSLVSALTVIWFHGRGARNVVTRFFSGLYSLYSMSSFIGDFLSYARLMALGLATVLIGLVINLLAAMILGGFRLDFLLPLRLIFALPILLGGHSFNLIINLLGAFVHPLRLQYVEFFKQFYDDGGRRFSPFAIETKHLAIRAEEES